MKLHINLIIIFSLLAVSYNLYASKKVALIFGATGQDGIYLTQFLLEKDYEVHGVKRQSSNSSTIDYLFNNAMNEYRFFLHIGDVTDNNNVLELINKIEPDEIYNLAAQSNVSVSFNMAEYTANTDALGPLRILEAIRHSNKKIRFFQASSSEMFGQARKEPLTEQSPFDPQSPYAIAKLYAYHIVKNYRKAYNLFACNGILFNHESPFRTEAFVSRKITRSAARITYNLQDKLYLGNLNAQRDWGYAKDYIEPMWLTLQQPEPDDYIIATGKTHSVRDFVELTFKYVGIEIDWKGQGLHEKGINKKTGATIIEVDPKYFRPTDFDFSVADPSYTAKKLGWHAKTELPDLIKLMIEHDLKEVKSL